MADEMDGQAEVEERLVNDEYKIWKKNTPFLYGGSGQLVLLKAWTHWAAAAVHPLCLTNCNAMQSAVPQTSSSRMPWSGPA